MTILDFVQSATGNKHHHAAIDAPAHGIAPRPPLTAEGMAAYAGVMATFTGTAGNDTINGGAGADTINGGAGNDTITFDGSDVSIAGGTGTDTLIVKGAATINLSLADQTSGDTANVTGFENVDASTSSAAVRITGDANANRLTGGTAPTRSRRKV